MSRNATHSHSVPTPASVVTGAAENSSASAFFWTGNPSDGPYSTTVVDTDHNHFISFNTNDRNTSHTHALTGTAASTGDANEARPNSMTVLTCIKR